MEPELLIPESLVDEEGPLPCPSCGVLQVWGYCRECDAPDPADHPF